MMFHGDSLCMLSSGFWNQFNRLTIDVGIQYFVQWCGTALTPGQCSPTISSHNVLSTAFRSYLNGMKKTQKNSIRSRKKCDASPVVTVSGITLLAIWQWLHFSTCLRHTIFAEHSLSSPVNSCFLLFPLECFQ